MDALALHHFQFQGAELLHKPDQSVERWLAATYRQLVMPRPLAAIGAPLNGACHWLSEKVEGRPTTGRPSTLL